MVLLLSAILPHAVSEPLPVRKIDIGRFIKLSKNDFRALDSIGYEVALLRSMAVEQPADPLGMTLASMCFEILSVSGTWKSATESSPEILVRGSTKDFHPVEYDGDYSDIVSAFYSYDGEQLLILPFHVRKDSPNAAMLPEISGSIIDLEKMVNTLVGEFWRSLLGRIPSSEELIMANPPGNATAPPESFSLSSQMEWAAKSQFQAESRKFSSALGRLVASISLSVLSTGTYFLYSEAYSRSAAEIGAVYASGSAAIVFVAASAAFAVESIIRLSRLLRYSH